MKKMAAQQREAHTQLMEETTNGHLVAQEKMAFYIYQVVSIHSGRTFVAAHTAAVTQTTTVIGGLNKIGEMMATLTGGQWAEMKTPNIDNIPLASQSILSKAQHLTRSIPVELAKAHALP